MNWPNFLTLLRIFLVPLFMLLFFRQGEIWLGYLAFLVFFLASLTDYYDGLIARRTGTVTRFGRFMDPLADKVLICSAFIAFALSGYITIWLVMVIVIREIIITGLRVYGLYYRNPLITSRIAKWKTSAQMIVIYLLFIWINLKSTLGAIGWDTGFLNSMWLHRGIDGLILLVTALTVVSGGYYLIQNLVLSRRRVE